MKSDLYGCNGQVLQGIMPAQRIKCSIWILQRKTEVEDKMYLVKDTGQDIGRWWPTRNRYPRWLRKYWSLKLHHSLTSKKTHISSSCHFYCLCSETAENPIAGTFPRYLSQGLARLCCHQVQSHLSLQCLLHPQQSHMFWKHLFFNQTH